MSKEVNAIKDKHETREIDIKAIGVEEIRKAIETFKKYKKGKENLDKRVIQNEDWWKLNHWRNFKTSVGNTDEPKPVSAWLFNSINNKHADFMDNFPLANVLPREQSDEKTAKVLGTILPVILENCNFEKVYSDNATEKLKNGPAIYGVYFNPKKLNGLGDIDIRLIDVLNFFWEPGIQDIQDSRNIFLVSLMDNDVLKAMYPELEDKLKGGNSIDKNTYNYDDTIDTTDKSLVYDWYYKKNYGQGEILHYVKFVDDIVLYASENEEAYKESGYYEHGLYPFVVDVLFEEKGTPTGFGYIDIMKSPQEYIDKLNQSILENAQWGSKPRYFIKDNSAINEEEFANKDNSFIHVAGQTNEDNIRPIDVMPFNGNYLAVLQHKIDELKETSGNRDFSQGSTTAGVTAASAIAALQEAGSKTSRDMIKASYRAFTKICTMIIELIRQFYDEPRIFRILGDSGNEYVEFDNSGLKAPATVTEFGIEIQGRKPVFDIKVKAQKSSPYAREAQNELALQFFNLGFFNPELSDQVLACIEMMDFEGKEKVREQVSKNKTMYEQLQQMQATMIQMAELIANSTGDTRILDLLENGDMGQNMNLGANTNTQTSLANNKSESLVDRAKDKTRQMSEVK